jgi:hypothetical protein
MRIPWWTKQGQQGIEPQWQVAYLLGGYTSMNIVNGKKHGLRGTCMPQDNTVA